MSYKKIGIIGGMGAAAGAKMLSMLIEECQRRGAVIDSDFPEIALHSVPTKGLDHTGIIDPIRFLTELAHSVKLLNTCGVEIIMIACNTAYIFHNELQSVSRAKILNMVEIACEGLEGKAVAVLSSRTTRNAGLYTTVLSHSGIQNIIEMDEEDQETIDTIIDRVISGRHSVADSAMLHKIIQKCERHADVVILGCTELTEVLIGTCIDPMEKIIDKALSE